MHLLLLRPFTEGRVILSALPLWGGSAACLMEGTGLVMAILSPVVGNEKLRMFWPAE
jgi:hypothetical protein